jgi:acetylornithine deacetylase/succinyl-diaminopimelate desuccinylase-like protein
VEVHIEQGPVLNELDIPLGIVTSINGSARYVCEFIGMASHAGTTPMDRRRDAAAAWPSCRCTSKSAPARTATAWPPSAS